MPEKLSSLHVYRPVLNIGPVLLGSLLANAEIRHVQGPDISDYDLYATILSPGELRAALEPQALPRQMAHDLGDYLIECLPASSNEDIHVPTLPVSSLRLRGQSGRQIITIGTQNAIIQTERAASKSLVGAYLCVPDLAFPDNDLHTHVEMGRFRSDPDASRTRTFCSFLQRHPELLPAEIVLGPVSVDDVR
jgi:hypothetical protein